ncbi:PREDICTED: uncharacterized protein LOC104802623 [Tarenaya hassleriana]|uniref:uncharacterized protein LOC104802623 n=1 Tax=Tarenaya hassleriana TaxID=28532 RepID=UPI00053C7793|nr:PREDICTED: uncharacterized protein LOC104802623 [Tarenaya hassleriana]
MRIRKRQVPLPLSSLLPVPLSDLYSNRSPAITHGGSGGDDGCRGDAPPHPPSSDLSDGLIRRWSIDGYGFSDHRAHDDDEDGKKPKEEEAASGHKRIEGGEDESDEAGSKNVDPGPETAVGNPSRESSSPSQEGQKVVPLKKRRGVSSEEDNDKAMASVNMEMKMKKCVGEIKKPGGADEDGGKFGSMASKGRKKARGSALAVGSRCSRVNGRGWRCCQQTLVGYSLCEHHLGKGRLRSISASSKNGHGKKKERNSTMKMTNSSEEETAKKKKKRVKLGMVKARSISSLLGQTSSTDQIAAPTDQYGDK